MNRLKYLLPFFLIVGVLLSRTAYGAGIFNTYTYSDGDRRPSITYEEDGIIIEPDNQEVVVSSALQLAAAITAANGEGPKTILLEDGTYTLDDMLWVEAQDVMVRSLSGNRNRVIIEGRGMTGPVSHIFNVAGSNFTVRDMTLREVSNHAIQLQVDIDSVSIRNVHILDTFEQMVKVAYDPDNMSLSSDNGLVENCLFEYSAGIGPQWYIGGVDAHNARGWIVRDNTFRGIRSPSGDVAEFAIHFWSSSEGTLVERNTIINCDRGIGFGLGDRGHVGGIIRNNMIYHDSSEGFADVGIALESVTAAQVYNNSVYQEHTYPNAIEYRFPATIDVLITNNLSNKAIAQRDGASATISNNIINAEEAWFVNPQAGDLHLAYPVSMVLDRGQFISGLYEDFDRETRPQGSGYEIGADEYVSGSSATVYVEPDGSCGGKSPCYYTIQDAINTASSGAEIRVIQGSCREDIVLAEAKEIALYGGWDATFSSRLSDTTIMSMTISDGTIIPSNLILGDIDVAHYPLDTKDNGGIGKK